MAYRCRNCGKFVAKDATSCKNCGQENPAEWVENKKSSNNYSDFNALNNVWCPYCGTQYTLPKELESAEYLHCNECGQDFKNPCYKSNSWFDGSTLGYPNRQWGCAGLFVLIFTIAYVVIAMDMDKTKDTTPKKQPIELEFEESEPLDVPEEDEKYELVSVNGNLVKKEAMPKSEYSIVKRWMETNMGVTSKECRIEQIKKDGRYRIKIGGVYYSCTPAKIRSNSEIIFHDANSHNGEFFNLPNGTPIFYVSKMECDETTQTDGILVIQADGSAQFYMNDYNPLYFELFTYLRPI